LLRKNNLLHSLFYVNIYSARRGANGYHIKLPPREPRQFFYVIACKASYCPVCSKPLSARGRRRRALNGDDGDKIILMIRRLLCIECNRIHHELPDCVVPYKRHCAKTIENVINGGTDAPCESRTITRILAWWLAVRACFINISSQMQDTMESGSPTFKQIICVVVNSNGWIMAPSFCTHLVVKAE